MIDPHRFVLFLASATLLAIAPGPGMLYVLARTLAGGRREGVLSSLGTFAGGLVHVLAAATGLFYLVLMQCMRHLRLWRWHGRPYGAALVRAIPIICCAMIVLRVVAVATGTRIEPVWPRGNLERAAILHKLENSPGKHLVIVSYAPDHYLDMEWVYNAADIDGAKVVWARDMDLRNNAELLRYFRDRQAWSLDADQSPPTLKPWVRIE